MKDTDELQKFLEGTAEAAILEILQKLTEVSGDKEGEAKTFKAGDAFNVLAMMTRHLAKECATYGTPEEAANGVARIVQAGAQGISEANQ